MKGGNLSSSVDAAGADQWPTAIAAAIGHLVWPLFLIIFAIILRREIRLLIDLLFRRLSLGDGVKFGPFEIETTKIIAGKAPASESGVTVFPEKYEYLQSLRKKVYNDVRGIMVVHRIFRSIKPGQLFDIEIYCIPHKGYSTAGVKSVTYCLGSYWKSETYCSSSRYDGFLITTEAYGPVLCVAEIEFADGEKAITSRYIDFEMGSFAAATLPAK